MHMYVMPCILLKPVSKCFELDPRPLHFMLKWSTFWLEKIFKPFVAWEGAQDAISCSLYNHSFWNFHNSKVIERSAHWRHKIMAPSNIRLDFPTPATSGTFYLCTVLVEVISYSNQCSESCNLSYSLLVYPICTRKEKTTFFFFTFDTSLSFQLPPPHLLVSFIA